MATLYSVVCECSNRTLVPATAAGSSVACACGRDVAVPSLRELRRLAVETGDDPQHKIEQVLGEGRYPGPLQCALCGSTTYHVRRFHVWSGNPELKDFDQRFRWLWPLLVVALVIPYLGRLMFGMYATRRSELAGGSPAVD